MENRGNKRTLIICGLILLVVIIAGVCGFIAT